MMTQNMVSRTQRRIEKKQAWLIVILVLAVSVASFALGVMVGRRGLELPGFADGPVQEVRLPMAATVPPPTPPATPAEEKPQLTFYDNLPQGSQAPLGSGINLPPESATPVQAEVPAQAAAPKPKAVAVAPAAAPAKTASPSLPQTAADGAFVVQIASFRTADDARKLIGRLQKSGVTGFVERADLGDKGIWHRVLAGPYADRGAADQIAEQLKQKERLSALVRRR